MIIPSYLCGSNVTAGVFIRGSQQKSDRQKQRDREKETEKCKAIADFENRGKCPQGKDYWRSPGTGKNKETDFPVELPEEPVLPMPGL